MVLKDYAPTVNKILVTIFVLPCFVLAMRTGPADVRGMGTRSATFGVRLGRKYSINPQRMYGYASCTMCRLMLLFCKWPHSHTLLQCDTANYCAKDWLLCIKKFGGLSAYVAPNTYSLLKWKRFPLTCMRAFIVEYMQEIL